MLELSDANEKIEKEGKMTVTGDSTKGDLIFQKSGRCSTSLSQSHCQPLLFMENPKRSPQARDICLLTE
jgi:hypothetical protein